MIVKLVWPDCDFLNGKWGSQKVDCFWVECSQSEAKEIVLPSLTLRPTLEDMSPVPSHIDSLQFCFLAARNLSSVVQMPWYYPYGGQWNAYCPFRKLPTPITLSRIVELTEIVVPDGLR